MKDIMIYRIEMGRGHTQVAEPQEINIAPYSKFLTIGRSLGKFEIHVLIGTDRRVKWESWEVRVIKEGPLHGKEDVLCSGSYGDETYHLVGFKRNEKNAA